MAVETVNYIADLNQTYPAGTEARAEGDDHLRNLKKALQQTFPGRTRPENAYVLLSGASVDFLASHLGAFLDVPSATAISVPKLGPDFANYTFQFITTLAGTLTPTGGDTVNELASVTYKKNTLYRLVATSNTTWKMWRLDAGSGIDSGTRMLFAQAAAPAGWTQDVSDNANNRMLRVVAGAGAGVGGSASPILNNVVPAHTHGFSTGNPSADHSHYTTTGGASADHSHGIGDPGHSHAVNAYSSSDSGSILAAGNAQWYAGAIGTTSVGTGIWTGGMSTGHYHEGQSGGMSANHTHSGTTDNGSSQTNWQPRYIDMIICTKD